MSLRYDFRFQGEAICTLDALQLLGDHNKENACAALSVAKYLDVENVACEEGLRNFTGLPHRLEFVREVDGVKYYDDSFSSAPPATKVAVRAFESPKLMICGGYDRGLDLKEMVDALMDATIKHRILIGQTAKAIASLLDQRDINDYEIVDGTIEEAVRAAKSVAVAGDVVILSPGCASFDMFKNFSERGKKFQEVVRQL